MQHPPSTTHLSLISWTFPFIFGSFFEFSHGAVNGYGLNVYFTFINEL